uniref:C-type lectin domain-containing protein n=1 Tax=Kryptolebias marmoratus TaxID=37003 RepID=A0A3Q3AX94_KRYMA
KTSLFSFKCCINLNLLLCVSAALTAVSSLPARSFYFVYEPKNWTEAQSYCREKYTDLATFESMEDVDILDNMKDLTKINTKYFRAWIGLYDDVNSWKWSMSDPDFYQQDEKGFRKWSSGQPNKVGERENCGEIYSDGFWHDDNCAINHHFICSDIMGKKSNTKKNLCKNM